MEKSWQVITKALLGLAYVGRGAGAQKNASSPQALSVLSPPLYLPPPAPALITSSSGILAWPPCLPSFPPAHPPQGPREFSIWGWLAPPLPVALPRFPSSSEASQPGVHGPAPSPMCPSLASCTPFPSTLFQPHQAVGSWTNWLWFLLSLGLCTCHSLYLECFSSPPLPWAPAHQTSASPASLE